MTMNKADAGRLGGKATLERYGATHMAKIGRKGFKALCTRFPLNSRRRALEFLNGKGKVSARYVQPPRNAAREDAAWAECCTALGLE